MWCRRMINTRWCRASPAATDARRMWAIITMPATRQRTLPRDWARDWAQLLLRRHDVARGWRRRGVATAAWATGPSGRHAARVVALVKCIDIAKSSSTANGADDRVRRSSNPNGAAPSATVTARRAILIGKPPLFSSPPSSLEPPHCDGQICI